MMKEAFEQGIKALAEKYGYEIKFEVTEKIMSLKLEDIIKAQKGKKNFYVYEYGVSCSISSDINDGYHTDQIKESSARKAMLFGMIQRIADYANGDWVADWDDVEQWKYVPKKQGNEIIIMQLTVINAGMPPIKSLDLYKQAIEQNKEIFEEFFKL